MSVLVRRIRADEWREVRDFRLEALQDPLAPLAFLETYEGRKAMPDRFWQERAAGAADGTHVSQWVAELGGEWIGTVVVIAFHAGETDHYGNVASADRADLVGVYVQPASRGLGVFDLLVTAAARWTREHGLAALELRVNPHNSRALRAYLRCGFVDTGDRVRAGDVADVVMRLEL